MKKNARDLVLGIDLGGTKVLTGVVNSRGEVISCDRDITPVAEGQEAVVETIVESANRSIKVAGASTKNLVAAGIGIPGPSNPKTGILFTSPHLPGWCDVPIRSIMQDALGVNAFLINDANAAAVGELHCGAARGARNMIYITVSTGIGSGVIIDGEIYTGTSGTAGELGHMTINDNGPLCNCGNNGCWESLASGTALAKEARRRIDEGARTSIVDYMSGDVGQVTAEVIHQAAQDGDGVAREIIQLGAYYLGVGLANLLNIFNPEVIVIGGGLSNMGDMLLQPAFREAERRAFQRNYQDARFLPAELGNNSGIIGAAIFALEQMCKND